MAMTFYDPASSDPTGSLTMKPRASFFSIATVTALAAALPLTSLGCAGREVVRRASTRTTSSAR
jgi:hypothetical protein